MRPRILVIDDDRELASMLAEFLGHEGFDVTLRDDARGDDPVIVGDVPDLVVLDVMLPGRNGFALLKELRAQWPRLPILMLTARGDAIDRILGLELGADDYLTKDISLPHLSARIAALFRRLDVLDQPTSPENLLQRDDLRLLALQLRPHLDKLVLEGADLRLQLRKGGARIMTAIPCVGAGVLASRMPLE